VTWETIVSSLGVLLAGHCLADFCLQTEAMVRGKRTSLAWLLYHGLQVFLAHLGALLVWRFEWQSLTWALAAAFAHVLTDQCKAMADRRWPRLEHRWFVLDQALHLAFLVLLSSLEPGDGSRQVERAAWYLAAYAFCVHGGSALVGMALGPKVNDEVAPEGKGQRIGILERVIVLTLVLLDQWSAIGFILTAKSVARFSKLDKDQLFAERYLVGTLASVIVAGACGLGVRAAISVLG
jgi:uncharacterized protein DUF3307